MYLRAPVRPVHYISIVIALLFSAGLYLFLPTVPPAGARATDSAPHSGGNEAQGPMAGMNSGAPAPAASTQEVLAIAARRIEPAAQAEVRRVEDSLSQSGADSVAMAPAFGRLARLWASHHQGAATGHYLLLEGKLEKSAEKLNFAGRFFLNLVATQPEDSPSVRMWNAQQAVASFRQAQEIAPADSTTIDLATAYIEGTGETMQGVQLLLGIVRKNPDNVPALLLLGRLAIQSGQWDKAVERFETVLRTDPQNKEALYFLAEAYKGKGDRTKAIETFERVKKAVDNPEFSRDIDAYIKTF